MLLISTSIEIPPRFQYTIDAFVHNIEHAKTKKRKPHNNIIDNGKI